MLPENKDIPQFLPEYPSYYRFPQADKKDTTVHRETLRQVWNDACCGQDFDTAVKVLRIDMPSICCLKMLIRYLLIVTGSDGDV